MIGQSERWMRVLFRIELLVLYMQDSCGKKIQPVITQIERIVQIKFEIEDEYEYEENEDISYWDKSMRI